MKFAASLLLFAAAASAQPGRVLVIDDFEPPAPSARWSPAVQPSRERASHGTSSGKITFRSSATEVRAAGFPAAWRAYDRLLFDIWSPAEGIRTLSLRIADRDGSEPDDYFQARSKIAVQKGWNHVEVKLPGTQAASFAREISLDAVRSIALSADRVQMPWTSHIDNVRLVAGEEPAASASRTEPQDTVSIIQNRWFTLRQVARPEDVPESAAVKKLRADAERELAGFRATLRAAQLQGLDTIYAERYLAVAELGLNVRPRMVWFNNDAQKTELFTQAAAGLREGRRELEDLLDGVVRLPHADDTQAPGPLVPPYAPLKGSPARGWYFRDAEGRPMHVISLHAGTGVLDRFFASPAQHIESYTVGGGSRWNIEQSPVYAAFQKYPDARRVGWDGWCGHLIRDLHSMGGSKMENTVICLESPHIQQAVEEFIRINIPRLHANPQLLYNIMAYELMYICYCDRSQRAFRQYLEKKHGGVAHANGIYGTSYRSFDEIAAPPVKNSKPLPGTNRALWYDWVRFNQDRFTDYLLWVKGRIRKIDPNVPLAAGGSSSMLAGRTGTTGIDEERIVNEVDDVIIHEGAGSTMGMDLQVALAGKPKPLADPEMSLDSVYSLLPHALHGKSVMQFFHWPAQPQNEYFSMNMSSLPHSPRHSLRDIGELLRATLDARRLSREIEAFVEAPAQVAILYSQTSTLQLPPEMLTWATTPYLAELRKSYDASLCLDARTTFVTERQVLGGKLSSFKLLIVPAARNVPAAVAERIHQFASAGGRVLIVPESLLGDEYNRPGGYLARFGVTVEKTWHPPAGAPGAMVQGYDQSFSQEVSPAADVRVKLAGPDAIETQGVRQALKPGAGAATVFRYPDGSAAIVRVPAGSGAVWYSGASLETRGYARLLERIFTDAGVDRPVRARSADPALWRVEARIATLDNRRLLYVINHENAPVKLRLEGVAGPLQDLRAIGQRMVEQVELPAHQTGIYVIAGNH